MQVLSETCLFSLSPRLLCCGICYCTPQELDAINPIMYSVAHNYDSLFLFHTQIRSVGPDGIPKWSTPSIAQRFRPVPPPTNITVIVTNDPVLDTESKVVEVIARVQWELPVLDGGGNPGNEVRRRRRQQSDEGELSQSGSGMGQRGSGSSEGSGKGGDEEPVPVQLGELTNIFIYMGTVHLDSFAPRPEENVQELKVL